jgi:hypothetical protein
MREGTLEDARRKANMRRDVEMLREKLAGMSYAEIAEKHGLSVSYVGHQIRWVYELRREELPDDLLAKIKEMEAE